MKKYLKNYLKKLSNKGLGLDLYSVECNYEKFTIYCLTGPEENIIHLSFTPAGHERIKKYLTVLHNSVNIKIINQKDFRYNTVFEDYFTGKLKKVPIRVDSPFINAGTSFQQMVWKQISAIPYGSCITYRKLAEVAGSPKAARAAGTACGANPLPIIIPCHRVKAQNGLGGFGGGLDTKRALLALEKAGAGCFK